MTTTRWTLLDLLTEATHFLSQKEFPTARLDAEVLLAKALDCRRLDLYLRYDQPIGDNELDRFRELIRRRSKHEPVAYIAGEKEFWSLPFKVNPDVLIPRPETELLVEAAVDTLKNKINDGEDPIHVLEIGTGSGAIAVALASEFESGVSLTATDRSKKALETARKNAETHGVADRIEFVNGDLFASLDSGGTRYSLILSNPPYIRKKDVDTLSPEIRDYEPREALDGGPDGLDIIRRILDESPKWLADGGFLMLEVGADQRPDIDRRLKEDPGWATRRWKSDLAGIDRVLTAQRSGSVSKNE